MKHLFNCNVDNFNFSFLSRGQFRSLSIDKFFLTYPVMSTDFLVTLFLHLLLNRLALIVLRRIPLNVRTISAKINY